MKIGFIGAGKVGCSIGKYLTEHGVTVAGYVSRSRESADEAATFTDTKAFDSLEKLIAVSDILFITTPDDCIEAVWKKIKVMPIQEKIICHFSGSLSSVVFSGREQAGASGCSVHPMYAFSDKFTSFQKLNQVMFTMEGDEGALAAIKPLFEGMGNAVSVISPESKVRYHAASSMVSNMMIGLYQMSIDMLTDCGFEEKQARQLVEPLVRNNVENMLRTSPAEALTGPIERNDVLTVKKHLQVLDDREQAVYKNLGDVLVELAGRKNPGRDYSVISENLGGKDNRHLV